MVEYALLVALIAALASVGVYYLGADVADALCRAFDRHYDPASMSCVPREDIQP